MADRPNPKPRSGCPVSMSLEVFGDRWSLLIVRDMMVRGFHTFKQFQESEEGIATNILADRLKRLESAEIISAEADPDDARKVNYRLTEKGIDLAPIMLEVLIWGARHQETGAPYAVIEHMAKHRDQVLAEVRRRWHLHDSTPLLPWLGSGTLQIAPTRRNRSDTARQPNNRHSRQSELTRSGKR